MIKCKSAWLGAVLIFLVYTELVAQVEEGNDFWDVPEVVVGDSTKGLLSGKVKLTGRVVQTPGNIPIAGALVSINSLKFFDYTDANGAFFLEIPPGSYRMKVRQLGMKPVYVRLRLVSDGVLPIAMEVGSIDLNEVVITARPIDSNVKGALSGLTKMSIAEIKSLPTLAGEVDVVRSLQLMPGVTSVGEGSSGFNVRGGRTDQNLVLLNGFPMFSTSHALGFIPSFNQDVIKDFALYKGNVPSNHGGRAASVMEINTRRGDFEKWNYNAGIGAISSRLTIEGPIVPNKTSVMVSGRASYANWFLRSVRDPDVNKSSSVFNDYFLQVNHRFSETSYLDLSYYSTIDEFQFSDQFGYRWLNDALQLKYQALADRKASPAVSLSYGRFKTTFFDPSGIDASAVRNNMRYLQFKPFVNYSPTEKHEIVAGASFMAYLPEDEKRTGYNGNQGIPFSSADKDQGVEFAAFIHDDFEVSEKFSVSAGIRYSRFVQLGADSILIYEPGQPLNLSNAIDYQTYGRGDAIASYQGWEPRISLRYSFFANQSIKVSYNRMYQYIQQISNTTAPTPIDLWQVSGKYIRPQIADNYAAGYFMNFEDNTWETSAEVFYKEMDNLIEYKDFPELFVNPHLETELVAARGRAYGLELFVRKLKGNWTGWLSYTYSQTRVQTTGEAAEEQINRGNWFPSNYNKPHTLNLVLNKAMNRQSSFALIFTYQSGRPLTALENNYMVNGTVVPIYSDRNRYSIPNYVRLDISFTIGRVFGSKNNSLVISIYNLLSRENAYSVFYRRPNSNFAIPKPFKLAVIGAAFPSITYNIKLRK